MDSANEILRACNELGVEARCLNELESKNLIERIKNKYQPEKLSGHLSIGHGEKFPLEENEFIYSKKLKNEPIHIFFDQGNFNRNKVIEIHEGKRLCEILEHSFGMEYFVTNNEERYLLSVNWYVIEAAGDASYWRDAFQGQSN